MDIVFTLAALAIGVLLAWAITCQLRGGAQVEVALIKIDGVTR